ncbi:hypothetical protein J2Z82_001508 [Virgibacillus litoralis]|uniref:Multidrug transporter n=1 Tax=Virgibacillus litoralis TaxID=578221 RepID=A0ABS4HDQ6_9BACI|nr:hypothetical protein [Virgibacillus litoralis]
MKFECSSSKVRIEKSPEKKKHEIADSSSSEQDHAGEVEVNNMPLSHTELGA